MIPRFAILSGLLAAALPCQAAETWREPNTGMEFVALPKGCFQMGVPAKSFDGEAGSLFAARLQAEKPEHEVCLDAFWLGRYEVRAAEWRKIMGETGLAAAPDAPVTGISWEEAREFARRLSAMSGGRERFRLPTEAEWEYACRAGAAATSGVPGRNVLEDKAWFSSPYAGPKNSRLRAVQPGGRKAANAFGLHDMLGNAWEWVEDSYRADAYGGHALYNPVVADAATDRRVIRGGGYRSDQRHIRCEARGWMTLQESQDAVGLRLVRTR